MILKTKTPFLMELKGKGRKRTQEFYLGLADRADELNRERCNPHQRLS